MTSAAVVISVVVAIAAAVVVVAVCAYVQVFTNLLRNSAKFCPPGGQIQIRTCVLDRAAVMTQTGCGNHYSPITNEFMKRESQHICIEIKDTGKGISATALKKLFSPFEQTDISITKQYGYERAHHLCDFCFHQLLLSILVSVCMFTCIMQWIRNWIIDSEKHCGFAWRHCESIE